MTEEIRDLIEKINQEGIKAAEEKSQRIEAAAKQRADEILTNARLKAEEMIAAAKDRIRREDEKGRILLVQAARDLLLTLRKELNTILMRIVISDIRQTLTPEALFHLISDMVRNYHAEECTDITVSVNKRDLEILEKYFFHKLKEETLKKITLKYGEEISGGFTISFDGERSCFDFTDKALADYIGMYLKPKLNQILQEAIRE